MPDLILDLKILELTLNMFFDRRLLQPTQFLGQRFKGRYNTSGVTVRNATLNKSNFKIPVYLNYPQLFKVQIVEDSVFTYFFEDGTIFEISSEIKPPLSGLNTNCSEF